MNSDFINFLMECLIVEDLKLSDSFIINTSRNNIYKKIRTIKLETITSVEDLETSYENYTFN
uniref:Uncharacterized protein n=1 Tax=viral metagenome TaxID=1070528 RepID=A0A6C0EMV6_9ZZZZ